MTHLPCNSRLALSESPRPFFINFTADFISFSRMNCYIQSLLGWYYPDIPLQIHHGLFIQAGELHSSRACGTPPGKPEAPSPLHRTPSYAYAGASPCTGSRPRHQRRIHQRPKSPSGSLALGTPVSGSRAPLSLTVWSCVWNCIKQRI